MLYLGGDPTQERSSTVKKKERIFHENYHKLERVVMTGANSVSSACLPLRLLFFDKGKCLVDELSMIHNIEISYIMLIRINWHDVKIQFDTVLDPVGLSELPPFTEVRTVTLRELLEAQVFKTSTPINYTGRVLDIFNIEAYIHGGIHYRDPDNDSLEDIMALFFNSTNPASRPSAIIMIELCRVIIRALTPLYNKVFVKQYRPRIPSRKLLINDCRFFLGRPK
jgi:hypothetical protein